MGNLFLRLLVVVLLLGSGSVFAQNTLSGEILLPAGTVATEDIDIQLSVYERNFSSSSDRVVQVNLTIPLGQDKQTFEFANLEPIFSGSYFFRFNCNCDQNIVKSGVFTATGVDANTGSAFLLDGESSHSNVVLQLSEGISLSGNILVPASVTAEITETIYVQIRADYFEEDGSASFSYPSYFSYIQLSPSDSGFVPFSIENISERDGKKIRLSYYCYGPFAGSIEGCERMYREAFYSTDSMLPTPYSANEFDHSQSYDDLTLSLVESVSISGAFNLPSDFPTSQSLGVFFEAEVISDEHLVEGGDYFSQTQSVLAFIDGNQINYLLNGFFKGSGSMVVSFNGSNGYPTAYYPIGYYAESGTVVSKEEAASLSSLSSHVVNFDPIRKNEVTGTLNVVDLDSRDYDISATVTATVYSKTDSDFERSYGVSVEIPQGETSADFIIIGVDEYDEDYYAIIDYIMTYRPGITYLGYYNIIKTVGSLEQATELEVESSFSGIDLTIRPIQPHSISGTVRLPEGQVASEDINITLSADISHSDSVTILSGEFEVEYELTNLPLVDGDNYHILTELIDTNDYVSSGYYSENGLVRSIEDATSLPAEQDFEDIDIILEGGDRVSGVIGLQGNFLPTDEYEGSIEITSFSASGIQLDNSYSYFVIGTDGIAYNFVSPSLWSDADGYYEIGYSCNSNCRLFIDRAWVDAQGDMSTDPTNLPKISNGGEVTAANLTVLEGHTNLVYGEIVWENDFVADTDSYGWIMYESERPQGLGTSLDRYRQEFMIPAGSNSVPFATRVRTAEDGGQLTVSYGCSNCYDGLAGPYYFNTNTAYSFNEAEISVLVASRNHNVDLELSRGTVFQGIVSIPKQDDRYGLGNVSMNIVQYDQFNQEVNAKSRQYVVANNHFYIQYEMSGLDALSGGYFVAEYSVNWRVSEFVFMDDEGYYLNDFTTVEDISSANEFPADEITLYSDINIFIGPRFNLADDPDLDGWLDDDNCPNKANSNQADKDMDGIGDVCDPVNDLLDPFEPKIIIAPLLELLLSSNSIN